MNETNLNSLRISGTGTYPGGQFDEVMISGAAKISQDITSESIVVSGKGTFLGNAKTKHMKISGTSKAMKEVVADSIHVSGSMHVKEQVKCKHMDMSGTFTSEKSIKAQTMKVSGTLYVGGNVEAEDMEVSGLITCNQSINADKLHLELHGTSEIAEFGGACIEVKASNMIAGFMAKLFMPKRFRYDQLLSSVIEADVVDIERTKAKVIRGGHVAIGEGCEIDLVEYTDFIDISEQAIVKEVVRKGED